MFAIAVYEQECGSISTMLLAATYKQRHIADEALQGMIEHYREINSHKDCYSVVTGGCKYCDPFGNVTIITVTLVKVVDVDDYDNAIELLR